MSKKKKSKKRRIQAVATSAPTAVAPDQAAAPKATAVSAASKPVAVAADPRWSYVSRDVKRIGVIAGSCIALELILWGLFDHTGLGASIYNLVKL